MKVFSIFDKAANIFNNPFFAPTEVHATRSFAIEVNRNEQSAIAFAPQDFSLYRIGSFDDQTGNLIPETPALIIEAVKVRKENN